MTKKLHVAPTLALPIDFVTGTQGILATKGMGKTYLAQVEAEELIAQGQQIVAIDPTDAWWGLRSSADGKHDGYPIAIFGGDHGDLQLDKASAIELADAVMAERFSCVICTDGLPAGAEVKFVREFLDRLYRKNREPIHVFVDEADMFAPQKPFDPEDAKSVRAMSNIVRRGRKKGIGCTMITQRPAVLNKDVLSQVDLLMVLGMSHNLDIEPVEKWIRNKRNPELAGELLDSLPTLQNGDVWAWSPRSGLYQKFRARPKKTFDSGATPKAGEKPRTAKKLTSVDIARLGERLAAAAEQQRASDPKALRARIAELEKQLEAKRTPAAKVETKTIEKAVIKDAQLARIEKLIERGEKLGERVETKLQSALAEANGELDTWRAQLGQDLNQLRAIAAIAKQPLTNREIAAAHFASDGKITKLVGKHQIRVPRASAQPYTHDVSASRDPGDDRLTGPERRILEALAWMESIGQPTAPVEAVAFLADYRPGGGAFNNTRGALRSKGFVDYPSGGTMRLTDEGRAWAPRPPQSGSGDQLRATVLDRLAGPERRVLEPLLAAYPQSLTVDELAAESGYGAGGGAFNNTRGRLRTLGLADYPAPGVVRAADLLFPESI